MRRISLRGFSFILALTLIASVFVATPASMAQGQRDFGAESGFLGSLNAQRASAGLGPLTLNQTMTGAAAGWTQQMVSGSFLAHASSGHIMGGAPGGWSKVGENVGRGQSVASLTQAFMASPTHRANIMDPSYTHVGIAVIPHPTDGRIYTTHRFAALPGSAPAPAAVVAQPTPIPPPPATATPIAPPPAPTAIPTAPVVPTPIPPPPPTALPATAVPATPALSTAVPATAIPVQATAVPPTATPEPTPIDVRSIDPVALTGTTDALTDATIDFGPAPARLAFVASGATSTEVESKRATKMAKAELGTEVFAQS